MRRSLLLAALLLIATPALAVVGVGLDSLGMPLYRAGQLIECSNEAGEGKYQKAHKATGETWLKGSCVGGLYDGTWKAFHKNGQKQWKGTLAAGKFEGGFRSWYENGQVRAKGQFLDGKATGKWKYWHSNGTLRAEGSWKAGKRSACWASYYDNEQKMWKGAYLAGEKVEVWYQWTAQGKKSKERFGGEASDGGCLLPW